MTSHGSLNPKVFPHGDLFHAISAGRFENIHSGPTAVAVHFEAAISIHIYLPFPLEKSRSHCIW